ERLQAATAARDRGDYARAIAEAQGLEGPEAAALLAEIVPVATAQAEQARADVGQASTTGAAGGSTGASGEGRAAAGAGRAGPGEARMRAAAGAGPAGAPRPGDARAGATVGSGPYGLVGQRVRVCADYPLAVEYAVERAQTARAADGGLHV